MKRLLAASALVLATAVGAHAQTTTTTRTTETTVTVQPEQRTKIETYITKSKPRAVTLPSSVTISKGTVLPSTVELQSFPADVGVTNYRYVYANGQTVLVEPGTRRIVEVID